MERKPALQWDAQQLFKISSKKEQVDIVNGAYDLSI